MCDGERPSVDRSWWARARTPHECSACPETIPIGAYYWTVRGLWEGKWQSFKHCVRCHAIWQNAIKIAEPGDVVTFDLSCGEKLEPDDPAQALAFLLPTDPPIGHVPMPPLRPAGTRRVRPAARGRARGRRQAEVAHG